MSKKVVISIAVLVCLILVCVLVFGNRKPEEVLPTETVPTVGTKAPTVEATTAEAPTAAPTEETEEPSTLPEVTEDTRPPIVVTIPSETQPYTDYERYNDMTAEEQEAFFKSFEDPNDFFAWYNEAKAEYEKTHPPIIIDGSSNIEINP